MPLTEFCARFNDPKSDDNAIANRLDIINEKIADLTKDSSSHNDRIVDLEARKAFLSRHYAKFYVGGYSPQRKAINYELANEFINFIHRPEIYAIFIDTFHYPCIVNTKAAEYTKEPSMYPPEQANNCTLKADLGSNVEKFYNLWQTIRFADHN